MADLNRDDILKLARLAHLKLTDEEVAQFTTEISAILGYVEQLQNVDVKGLEPTYQVTGLNNVTRSDVVKEYSAQPKDLLKNVPETRDGQIKVKRMIV